MPRSPFVLALGLLGLAALIAIVGWSQWFEAAQAAVRPVPPGCQEIAWIAAATSAEPWERLVAALKQLQRDWPTLYPGQALQLNLDRAFLDLTADVPEIGLGLAGNDAMLWIRWYKLSGENDSAQWVASLRKRGNPPVAIVGGDTSDRALAMAQALEEIKNAWAGPAPLFCITTATAERYSAKERAPGLTPHEQWPKLMAVYPGRTFRFSFTNSRMVEAVLDFVRDTPQVWLLKQSQPATCAATVTAATVSAATAWTSLGLLAAAGHFQPYYIYTIAWGDDGYSKDLAEIFARQFAEQFPHGKDETANVYDGYIAYGVGDYYQANPRERTAIDFFLVNRAGLSDKQHLLVLPTNAQRARRFLRTLCRAAPLETRNLVVVNGDAISFNNIYRDRDVAWNILDIPLPLVFFSHRDPIDAGAGFHPHKAATATQDLLLFRDIVEALIHAGHDQGRLLASADDLRTRLGQLRWSNGRIAAPPSEQGLAFFDAEGNRAPGTGEHIVWLHPRFEGTRILPRATITVWHVAEGAWRVTGEPLDVLYNSSSAEAGLAE
jgi:hypothetical protein